MITTPELAKQTGLSVKTLARWTEQGVLPKPHIGNHPSGRGKVGFWPDWSVSFCLRVIELRKEGITLMEAASTADFERMEAYGQRVQAESEEQVYGAKTISLPSGEKVDLVARIREILEAELRESILNKTAQRAILKQLKEPELLSAAIYQIQEGYHMFLTFDGTNVATRPDFLVERTGSPAAVPNWSFFAIPLTHIYQKLLKSLGLGRLIQEPKTLPVTKIWMKEGMHVNEYPFLLGGPFGFRLVGVSGAKPIGEIREDGDAYFL